MTIDTTIPPAPTRPARPTRTRKAPARWGRRRRLTIPRRRARGRFQLPDASAALNTLMQEGDLYKIGREHYFVALVRPDLLEMLILAAAGTEDDEAKSGVIKSPIFHPGKSELRFSQNRITEALKDVLSNRLKSARLDRWVFWPRRLQPLFHVEPIV